MNRDFSKDSSYFRLPFPRKKMDRELNKGDQGKTLLSAWKLTCTMEALCSKQTH